MKAPASTLLPTSPGIICISGLGDIGSRGSPLNEENRRDLPPEPEEPTSVSSYYVPS